MRNVFYDYETSGLSRSFDQVFSFGAVVTDENFNLIEDPIELHCRPRPDILPSPKAMLVNRLDLEMLSSNGLTEYEFARRIHDVFTKETNTCIFGYNSKKFDDSFTEFLFYRNLLPPYEWRFRNGNSSADLIELFRFAHSFGRLGGLSCLDENNRLSFKLEDLAKRNLTDISIAHDALSDAMTTQRLCKELKSRSTKLFEFGLGMRSFNRANEELVKRKQFLHSDVSYGAEKNNLALLTFIANHPHIPKRVIAWRLDKDPREVFALSIDDLKADRKLRFDAGFVELKVNRGPMIVAHNEAFSSQLIGFDHAEDNFQFVTENLESLQEIASQVNSSSYSPSEDVDNALYDSSFFDEFDANQRYISDFHEAPNSFNLGKFTNSRFTKLGLRIRARNMPEHLTETQKVRFKQFVADRLSSENSLGWRTAKEFYEEIAEIKELENIASDDLEIIDKLCDYAKTILPQS